MKFTKTEMVDWWEKQNVQGKLDKKDKDAFNFTTRYFPDSFEDKGGILTFDFKKWLTQHNIKKPYGHFYEYDSFNSESPVYWLSGQLCFYFAMLEINGKPEFYHWITKMYKGYYRYCG